MTFPTVHSELEELSFFIARGWGGVVVEGRGRGGGVGVYLHDLDEGKRITQFD